MENGQFQGLKCCFRGQFVTKVYARAVLKAVIRALFSPSACLFSGKGYNVDSLMVDQVSYEMRPGDLSKEIADTVSPISEICGKSTRTLLRTLPLLKNPSEIQTATRAGSLPVSQRYLFAENLDCPDLRNRL